MTATAVELRSWKAPAAQDAAKNTYASVKQALEASPALRYRSYEVFLQGSYANHTNIRGDSDVDVVVMLRTTHTVDLARLPLPQQQAWWAGREPVTYNEWDFRRDVMSALVAYYGNQRVEPKDKCIRVRGQGGYLDADVVPALQHRLYKRYSGYDTQDDFIEGIRIYPLSGGSIVNYPKEHISNGHLKNALCHQEYKPTVRQVKRLRCLAEDEGRLRPDEAPGYLLECMVYNAPTSLFTSDDDERVRRVVGFLASTDLSPFESCDGIHTLFGPDPGKFSVIDATRITSILKGTLG